MAKKRTRKKKETDDDIPPGQLGDWLAKVPKKVREAGDEFGKALTAKNKAKAKHDAARDRLIDLMRDTGTERTAIRGGTHVVIYQEKEGIKVESVGAKDDD